MIAAATVLVVTIVFCVGLPYLLGVINTPDEIYGDAMDNSKYGAIYYC